MPAIIWSAVTSSGGTEELLRMIVQDAIAANARVDDADRRSV
jgi:hypothetical protein